MTRTFLKDTWKFCRTHLSAFALIILPFTVPLEIVSVVYHKSVEVGDSFLMAAAPEMLYLLFYPIFGAGVVFYTVSAVDGHRLSASQAWNQGLRNWGRYFLLMAFLMVTVGLGFMLFILPGILLMAKLAFADFELLLQRKHPLDSVQSSWQQTTGHFWVLLQGGLVITAVVYLPIWCITYLLGGFGLYGEVIGSLLRIVESLLMVGYTVFAYRVYDHAHRGQ